MSWKPIDFQGIVALDNPVVDLLAQYLEEKEAQLGYAILKAIPTPHSTGSHPTLPPPSSGPHLKLIDVIDYFSKRDFLSGNHGNQQISLEDWKSSVRQINSALWQYIETLEGCVTELFQQLEQISLEQWHVRLSDVVGAIKEILLHKMEDLIWAIKRLENLLWKARYACENPQSKRLLWLKFSSLWTPLLDKSLETHLNKNQELLRNLYQKFTKRHRGYLSLLEQVEKSLTKLAAYRVLTSLDSDVRKQFIDLYQLLKLWEMNRTAKALPEREFVIALRNALSVDKATNLFRSYHQSLKKTLFEKSLVFKKQADELIDDSVGRTFMQESLTSCQAEIRTLALTIANYREFLLRADPDPYVRTRLGFPDRIVGSEPAQTKPLLNLEYDVEALGELYEQLVLSLKKSARMPTEEMRRIDKEVQDAIHEMGQPLATHRTMRSWAEKVLDNLQQIDELGSFDNHAISYIGQVFAKILRVDWKYNVLHGIPLFHQLYAIHLGLVPPIEDRFHANRLKKFHRLLQQVEDWVKNNKTQPHQHDIELDINDIKGYLQDFLGYVQRALNEPEMNEEKAGKLETEIAQELLEYRYLFGNFFYQLRQNELEGQIIRRQFLFVDQYFESIQYKLYELGQKSWSVEESRDEAKEPDRDTDND